MRRRSAWTVAPGRRRTHAFTLLELVMVLAIIGVLVSILLPLFARARERARSASCQSNLKQLGVALHLYAQDNDGWFPPASLGANETLYEYTRNYQVFQCPSSGRPWEGYPWRSLAGELPPGSWGSYQYYPGLTNDGDATARLLSDTGFVHNGRANVVLLGSRATSLFSREWKSRGWELPRRPEPPAQRRPKADADGDE